jgi:hypothetical protein
MFMSDSGKTFHEAIIYRDVRDQALAEAKPVFDKALIENMVSDDVYKKVNVQTPLSYLSLNGSRG